MSNIDETFFTSVGCMDGRGLRPVRKYGKKFFDAQYVDTITDAGLVGHLANPTPEFLESIKKKILISLEKHHSKGLIVHGHQECAGNPVEDETQKEHILKAADVIKNLLPKETKVIPIFVRRGEHGWEAVPIS